jgi:hypothetical protein
MDGLVIRNEGLTYPVVYPFCRKKNQSWGGGKLHMTREDSKRLKKAKSEGRINEAMLDRRALMKADRYCK